MPDAAAVWARSQDLALRECEILSEVTQYLVAPNSIGSDELVIDITVHPWVMLLTQDCDCDWDYGARTGEGPIAGHHKEVPHLLLCEALVEGELRVRPQIKSDIWRRIRDNQDERFHTLPAVPPELDALGLGVPELVLDFKRCFSVATAELYGRLNLGAPEPARRAFLLPPFRDQVSTRAFGFHARVATPE